jgi:hypothetical protein
MTMQTLRYQPEQDALFDPKSDMRINVTFGALQAFAGSGAHQLRIPLETIASWLDDQGKNTVQLLVTGRVRVERLSPIWLCDVGSQVLTVRGYVVRSDGLTLSLTDDQFVALERNRLAGDIRLILDLQFTLLDPPDGVYPVRDVQVSHSTRESAWMELLGQLGTEVAVVLRVPSPLSPRRASDEAAETPPATLVEAAAFLRDAREKATARQWKECVQACRDVLDTIGHFAPVVPTSQIPKERDLRGQQDRLANMFHATRAMAHAAHHVDAVTKTFVWNRATAEAVLGSTTALLLAYSAD